MVHLRGSSAAHLLAVVFFVGEARAFHAVFRRVKRKPFFVLNFRDIDEIGLAGGPRKAAKSIAEVDWTVYGA